MNNQIFSIDLLVRNIGILLLLLISCQSQVVSEQEKQFNTNKNLIDTLLTFHPERFKNILSNEKEYDIQIIYTQINRDENNIPSLKQFDYHLDSKKYFYPASLVKLPCSALALEKLNDLNISGLDKYSRMQTDSAWKCQKKVEKDTTSKNGNPSVAQYIKRMLLVSDNDAYSRIYEFLGQENINKRLADKGYSSVRIVHRFDANCAGDQNRYTNPVSFYDSSGKLVYNQPLQHNLVKYQNPIGTVKKGVGYVDHKDRYIYEPKDFTFHNYICLQDIHDVLTSIIFPEATSETRRFKLSNDDYKFLYKYMSMYPCESDYPQYVSKDYKDSYKKYFIYGTCNNKIEEDTLRIFNIVGQSYGYLSDCAYVCDFKNGIEFLLSAVIYVNKDGIINDAKYDYDEIGFPFLSNLGRTIYEYEKTREKEIAPDLSIFKFDYK